MSFEDSERICSLFLSLQQITSITTVSSYGFYATIDTPTGTVKTYKTNLLWKNINLQELFGDLWDTYDYFKLELTQFQTYIFPGTSASGVFSSSNATYQNYRSIDMYIGGFDWVGSSFNIKRNTNTAFGLISTISDKTVVATNAVGTWVGSNTYASINCSSSSNNYLIFRKNSQYVNINIVFNFTATDTVDMQYDATAFDTTSKGWYPSAFKFNFVPIKK